MHFRVKDNKSLYLRLAQLDKVLVSGAGWKASDVQVGFTQLFPAAVVAVVVATVGAGAGRSHGVWSWCIGMLKTRKKGLIKKYY